ncbi:hypothetical protein LOC68_02200 [Blastopirellula sp. JC732]|uniref:Caspase family protein n=1 Tax=Blastopirellula sediminis TaxID=2894196 RepID=A0A9X1SHH2_9BACT|nr:hypothetical protein [Blastopirellula sediminis]MCC9607998.1 hypothetical protein [Blastopirellula sediminis]MCC9627209.1 hypothetical protein [Blastopirellula sediminis]
MLWIVACVALLSGVEAESEKAVPANTVIVAVGEPGEPQYEQMFAEWAARWREATAKSDSKCVEIGLTPREADSKADRDILQATLAELAKDPPQTLWIVLIGHGTFDGKKAKFNLRGADITAADLAERLAPLSCRVAIVNCASASGPFLQQLTGENRAVITSTQSGFEHNFARFGGYLSKAIGDAAGDLDKDGQTSLLEAWLAAAKQTQEYYDSDSRLATEHSLLDDNGDGKGTPADWFRGIHIIKTSKDAALPDGTLANQFILTPSDAKSALPEELRQQRDELERKLAELRQQKETLAEEEYLQQLEAILIPLAKLYQSAEAKD